MGQMLAWLIHSPRSELLMQIGLEVLELARLAASCIQSPVDSSIRRHIARNTIQMKVKGWRHDKRYRRFKSGPQLRRMGNRE